MTSDEASERQVFGGDEQQMDGRMLLLVQREGGHWGPAWENKGHEGCCLPERRRRAVPDNPSLETDRGEGSGFWN